MDDIIRRSLRNPTQVTLPPLAEEAGNDQNSLNLQLLTTLPKQDQGDSSQEKALLNSNEDDAPASDSLQFQQNSPLVEILWHVFVENMKKDPQSAIYIKNFGKDYKKNLLQYLHKHLPDQVWAKNFNEMTFEDLQSFLSTLNKAIEERLKTAKRSHYLMAFSNSVLFALPVALCTLSYLGLPNGGCNNEDYEGDAAKSYSQMALSATVVSFVGLVASFDFAHRQDTNNHFTEIEINTILTILRKMIDGLDPHQSQSSLEQIREKLTPEQFSQYQQIERELQKNHHDQHIEENFRFRMRILTIICLAARGTILCDKVIELLKNDLDKEAFCKSEGGKVDDSAAAFILHSANFITALQSFARNFSNTKREKTFTNQMGDSGILGLLQIMKQTFGDNVDNQNNSLREMLFRIANNNVEINFDSHAHGTCGGHHSVAPAQNVEVFHDAKNQGQNNIDIEPAQAINTPHAHDQHNEGEHGHGHQCHGHGHAHAHAHDDEERDQHNEDGHEERAHGQHNEEEHDHHGHAHAHAHAHASWLNHAQDIKQLLLPVYRNLYSVPLEAVHQLVQFATRTAISDAQYEQMLDFRSRQSQSAETLTLDVVTHPSATPTGPAAAPANNPSNENDNGAANLLS